MGIPHRGKTTQCTYFVTRNVFKKGAFSRWRKIAPLLIEILLYSEPRAMQFIKGGFTFQLNRNLKTKRNPWQPSFFYRRIRDSLEYARFKGYIWQKPVKRFLACTPEEYPYSSANPIFKLDAVPQRLKPISSAALPQA